MSANQGGDSSPSPYLMDAPSADIILQFNQGGELKAHSVLLKMVSPNVLAGALETAHGGVLRCNGDDIDAWELMLTFIYPVMTKPNLTEVCFHAPYLAL